MDYNKPFDQTDPSAGYVNGNPATSTPGSIPCAEGLEYPQREIVSAEKLAGLTPSNTDLTQMAQVVARGVWVGALTGTGDLAIATLGATVPALKQGMRVRGVASATNTTTAPMLRIVNVGSAGGAVTYPIVKADGSAPAIGEITAGQRYEYEVDGANPANVIISGGGLIASTDITTAVTKTVFGTGADFPDLSSALTWIGQRHIQSTGSVKFKLAAGPWVISAADILFRHPDGAQIQIEGATMKTQIPAPSTLQITGNTPTARTNDTNVNLAAMRAAFGTELAFTGGKLFRVDSGFGKISSVLITSDGTYGGGLGYGLYVTSAGIGTLQDVIVVGTADSGLVLYHGNITATGTIGAIGCGAFGVTSRNGGSLGSSATVLAVSNANAGVYAWDGSVITLETIAAAKIYARGNGGAGVWADEVSIIRHPNGSTSSDNAGAGFWATNSSYHNCGSGIANNNGAAGAVASNGSYMAAQVTSGSGNAINYYASNDSFLDRTGGTMTGASGPSPALGTTGNNQANIL